VWSGGLRVVGFVARPDDNGNLFGSGGKRLIDQDAEQRFLGSVPVDESLKRQFALTPCGGGNDSFLD
jgi:Mrp family chromosome partitioning ATPase